MSFELRLKKISSDISLYPIQWLIYVPNFAWKRKKRKKYNNRKQFPPYFSNGRKNDLIKQPRDHTLVENNKILGW